MTGRRLPAKHLVLYVVLFLLGGVSIALLHLATFKNTNVHYHANFALYVNGKRDEFKSFTFYEEVQACTSDDKNNPNDRAHLHDNNPGLIHIHAPGVTWGHFFANLGYTLGDSLIQTDQGTYVDGQDGNKLSFILNGKPVSDIANGVIHSEDRLLINYGRDDDSTLQQRYSTVPIDAHQANTEHDPATCSGSQELTTWQRLKQAFID